MARIHKCFRILFLLIHPSYKKERRLQTKFYLQIRFPSLFGTSNGDKSDSNIFRMVNSRFVLFVLFVSMYVLFVLFWESSNSPKIFNGLQHSFHVWQGFINVSESFSYLFILATKRKEDFRLNSTFR